MIAAYAIRCHTAFIYCRGEFLWPGTVLERAVAEAYAGGYRARASWAATTPWTSCCTAAPARTSAARRPRCSNSLEGFRGQPRLRPPFPAVEGLYAVPTVINNVETLC